MKTKATKIIQQPPTAQQLSSLPSLSSLHQPSPAIAPSAPAATPSPQLAAAAVVKSPMVASLAGLGSGGGVGGSGVFGTSPLSPQCQSPMSVVGHQGAILGADGLALDDVSRHSMRMGFSVDVSMAKDPVALLSSLAKAIRACREVGIAWDEMLDTSDVKASGARLTQLLTDHRANPNIILSAAKHMNTPERLGIIPFVGEAFKPKLKEIVLARVLKSFASAGADNNNTSAKSTTTTFAAPPPMPSLQAAKATAGNTVAAAGVAAAPPSPQGVTHAAVMIVALVSLDLLSMEAVARLIEQQIRSASTAAAPAPPPTAAAVVAGNLASSSTGASSSSAAAGGSSAAANNDQQKAAIKSAVSVLGLLTERFSKNDAFVKSVSHLQPLLQREAVNDPNLEYEHAYVTRCLGWNLPGPQLRLVKRFPTSSVHSRPIVSSTYFSVTDELVTGGQEGSLCMWGSGDTPTARFTLPPSYIPAAMDGFTRGRVLAVACVAPAPNTAMIRLYQCPDADTTGTQWKLVETMEREECNVITCLRRINLKTNAFATAEYDGRSHNLVVYNMQGKVQRQVIGAHKDFTTVIQPSADYNWLFTGSRDTTVKAWDGRNFSTNAPLHTLSSHTDTITGLYTTAENIITGGLDGKLCLWDIRRLKKPVAEKKFAAPILRVAVCGASRPCIVVSTTQSLSLLSFTGGLIVDDVVSNTCYTDLRPNHDGSALFATGANGIDMYLSDPQ